MSLTEAANSVLSAAVDAGTVPGVVAVAADDAGVIYEGAFGERELGSGTAMTTDTVFWIASMTKAITSVAAMQLVEQGRLDLDEPLGRRLPFLDTPQVIAGFEEDGTPKLRPAVQPVTLRRLLTHTAGFAYTTWNEPTLLYSQRPGAVAAGPGRRAGLEVPLAFEPGERWEYGINIDWAGLAVEQESGLSLETYFRQNILEPLGMKDTSFLISDAMRERKVSMHRRTGPASFDVIPFEMNQNPEFFPGGGGLYSTGRDYIRFLRMLLGDGALDGVRILKPETVAEMGRNQIGDLPAGVLTSYNLDMSYHAEFFPGLPKRWGLGYLITMEEASTGRGAGSVAWAGMANTYFWLDAAKKRTGLLMTQSFPFADPLTIDVFSRFESAVYAG